MASTAVIRFDLRRAPFSTVTEAEQYAQCLEMARWADEHGFASVAISEHHGVDFVSAPTALAGLLLGATKRAHVSVNALLVPLHDPIRLAEERPSRLCEDFGIRHNPLVRRDGLEEPEPHLHQLRHVCFRRPANTHSCLAKTCTE